jgi:hypothetical protein
MATACCGVLIESGKKPDRTKTSDICIMACHSVAFTTAKALLIFRGLLSYTASGKVGVSA